MKLKISILILLAITISTPASAVMLSQHKQGQVLVFPYYGTLGGNNTNITVSSDSRNEKAIKVLFFDRLGNAAMSLNVYLGVRASWVASLSQVDGKTVLKMPGRSCTAPTYGDGSGSIEVPLTSGFLEVIEMGTISDDEIITKIREQDCEALNAIWAENGQWSQDPDFGIAAPNGKLRGSAMLINIEQGTMYSFVASALTQFSDIPQHTAPDSLLPDLTSAHDAGTDNGATTSIICYELRDTPSCIEDTFDRPVDAVAAAMSATQLKGEYSTESRINAKSEVILTYPLRAFYAAENKFQGLPWIILDVMDRSGNRAGNGQALPACISIVKTFCRGSWNKQAQPATDVLSVDILSFGDTAEDAGMLKTSAILGEQYTAFFPNQDNPTIPAEGSIWVGYDFIGSETRSNSGKGYAAFPVIGTVLQSYTNGQLQDENGESILANYGNALELSSD